MRGDCGPVWTAAEGGDLVAWWWDGERAVRTNVRRSEVAVCAARLGMDTWILTDCGECLLLRPVGERWGFKVQRLTEAACEWEATTRRFRVEGRSRCGLRTVVWVDPGADAVDLSEERDGRD